VGNNNPRYGELLKMERLQAPLGNQFFNRPQKAILITSHLREPRASCYELLKKHMPIDGIGPYFDSTIRDHHRSGFLKKDTLQNYAFNLCPENGLFPGYVTEKIPEAFAVGCLPIGLVDEWVVGDFNPAAFINLTTIMANESDSLGGMLRSKARLEMFAQQPLLLNVPSLAGVQKFVKKIIDNVR
jgi:hypothetical protein